VRWRTYARKFAFLRGLGSRAREVAISKEIRAGVLREVLHGPASLGIVNATGAQPTAIIG